MDQKAIERLGMKSLTTSNGICRPIKLSKDILSRAQFIAQLGTKLIIVNMDGILCAIDQHALSISLVFSFIF